MHFAHLGDSSRHISEISKTSLFPFFTTKLGGVKEGASTNTVSAFFLRKIPGFPSSQPTSRIILKKSLPLIPFPSPRSHSISFSILFHLLSKHLLMIGESRGRGRRDNRQNNRRNIK
eukprot:GHVT01041719.1.p1 GENE.GHVT01041719.1~~GHVT01041719.1.p1  ORF type:complete len:117 (-),score=3.40 GHVT01041719.1:726-1076(-)